MESHRPGSRGGGDCAVCGRRGGGGAKRVRSKASCLERRRRKMLEQVVCDRLAEFRNAQVDTKRGWHMGSNQKARGNDPHLEGRQMHYTSVVALESGDQRASSK